MKRHNNWKFLVVIKIFRVSPIQILFVDSHTDFKPESAAKIRLSHTKQAISAKEISKSAQLWTKKTSRPFAPWLRSEFPSDLWPFNLVKARAFEAPGDKTSPNRRGTGADSQIRSGAGKRRGDWGREWGESEKAIASGRARVREQGSRKGKWGTREIGRAHV